MSAPESAFPAPPPAPEDLQFQQAEYAAAPPSRVCAFCKAEVGENFFQVSGTVACAACLAKVREMQGPVKQGSLGLAFAYGLGAAIAGSVIYGLVSLSGFQFSIVAILVGVMVGKAMRKAMQGETTRACQVLAVVLTYGAITTSYLPLMISGAMKARDAGKSAKTQTPVPAAQNPRTAQKVTAGGFVAAIVILIGISLAVPFLVLAQSPLSGLINLLIIFIGLRQSWRLTTPTRTYVPTL